MGARYPSFCSFFAVALPFAYAENNHVELVPNDVALRVGEAVGYGVSQLVLHYANQVVLQESLQDRRLDLHAQLCHPFVLEVLLNLHSVEYSVAGFFQQHILKFQHLVEHFDEADCLSALQDAMNTLLSDLNQVRL